MGLSKTHEFNLADVKVANYARALAHPARIAILRLLLERQACICGDIVEELPLSQATVSQHLKELKEAGLITGDISGRKICYCIAPQAWQEAQHMLQGLSPNTKPAARAAAKKIYFK